MKRSKDRDGMFGDEKILKPATHGEVSRLPREAVCSAVSSRVRGNFGERVASRDREDKIKHA